MVMIGLDPGHGGHDTGAVACGVVERDYIDAFARALADELDYHGATVRLTREVGQDPGFWRRGIRTVRCDCVVSLHANASVNPGQRGLEVYHWPGSVRGRALARSVAVRCPQALIDAPRRSPRIYSTTDAQATSDDWLQRPRRVLRWHRPPAVLVELGYITNDQDRAYLLECMPELAGRVADGIVAWSGE